MLNRMNGIRLPHRLLVRSLHQPISGVSKRVYESPRKYQESGKDTGIHTQSKDYDIRNPGDTISHRRNQKEEHPGLAEVLNGLKADVVRCQQHLVEQRQSNGCIQDTVRHDSRPPWSRTEPDTVAETSGYTASR